MKNPPGRRKSTASRRIENIKSSKDNSGRCSLAEEVNADHHLVAPALDAVFGNITLALYENSATSRSRMNLSLPPGRFLFLKIFNVFKIMVIRVISNNNIWILNDIFQETKLVIILKRKFYILIRSRHILNFNFLVKIK